MNTRLREAAAKQELAQVSAAAVGHRRMHSADHYQSGAKERGPKMPMPDEQDLADSNSPLTWIDNCEGYFLHHGSEFEDDSVRAGNKYNPDLVSQSLLA